jgi:hypothetical protein
MGKTQTRLITLGLVVLQILLLAASVSLWWARRSDTLFSNGRWIVGKDTGKFVFYAHDFMFQPLSKSGVELTSCMGFQEILYRKPEDTGRQLTSLRCRASIANGAYLWVEARKKGQRMLGVRFSRHGDYPSGFYRYDESGEILERAPFDFALPDESVIHIRFRDGQWQAFVDNKPVGQIADQEPGDGFFGFRGSGWSQRPVTIRDIEMEFRDSARSGNIWIEREDFSYRPALARCFPFTLLFAGIVICLRRWRQMIFGTAFPRRLDDAGFCSLLAILLLCQMSARWNHGILIPAAIFGGEIIVLAGLLFTKTELIPGRFGLVYGLVLAAIGWAAFTAHGKWLGRSEYTSRAQRDLVPLAALIVRPDQLRSSPPIETQTITVAPGSPWFTEGRAYAAQRITADFRMPSNSTLDVVFQQQSFLTHGDPEGEELPLQRRLLRLSTRADVSTGLSRRTENRPIPFLPICGTLYANQENHLVLENDAAGASVTLNGETTYAEDLKPIGFGETGFLAYEQPVVLNRIRVEPSSRGLAGERVLPWLGLFLPFILATVARIVFRIPARLAFLAYYPLAFYAVGTLFLDTNSLASMGRQRFAWQNLALAATAFSHLNILAALRGRRPFGPLSSNVILLVTLFFTTLFIWDILPKDHPLRLKFTDEAIVPSFQEDNMPEQPGPWYNNNWMIGSGTYIWKQRFGAKRIPADKPKGAIRIFVVGGSQAWGSGAASSEQTFSQLLEDALRAKDLPVEIYNAAANGGGIRQILGLYPELLRGFRPDLLIADIGLNESAGLRQQRADEAIRWHTDFQAGLFDQLLSQCETDGVKVVLSLEPMCGETPLRPVDHFYDALENAARKHGGAVLKPAGLMNEKEKDHFVWWDTAHLAPYGQLSMARFLEPEVERTVREEK